MILESQDFDAVGADLNERIRLRWGGNSVAAGTDLNALGLEFIAVGLWERIRMLWGMNLRAVGVDLNALGLDFSAVGADPDAVGNEFESRGGSRSLHRMFIKPDQRVCRRLDGIVLK
jgi:hypothetical protein